MIIMVFTVPKPKVFPNLLQQSDELHLMLHPQIDLPTMHHGLATTRACRFSDAKGFRTLPGEISMKCAISLHSDMISDLVMVVKDVRNLIEETYEGTEINNAHIFRLLRSNHFTWYDSRYGTPDHRCSPSIYLDFDTWHWQSLVFHVTSTPFIKFLTIIDEIMTTFCLKYKTIPKHLSSTAWMCTSTEHYFRCGEQDSMVKENFNELPKEKKNAHLLLCTKGTKQFDNDKKQKQTVTTKGQEMAIKKPTFKIRCDRKKKQTNKLLIFAVIKVICFLYFEFANGLKQKASLRKSEKEFHKKKDNTTPISRMLAKKFFTKKIEDGSICEKNKQCRSKRCRYLMKDVKSNKICLPKKKNLVENGLKCKMDWECRSKQCKDELCKARSINKMSVGSRCIKDMDCVTKRCKPRFRKNKAKGKVCFPKKKNLLENGSKCQKPYECISTRCIKKVCKVKKNSPTVTTVIPTKKSTNHPTKKSTNHLTSRPSTNPSPKPSSNPSSKPSSNPSSKPSSNPSSKPSSNPSSKPSSNPSSKPSSNPSLKPSPNPSSNPSTSSNPSNYPSLKPSNYPSSNPSTSSKPSHYPSSKPSSRPSLKPSFFPSTNPSSNPSVTSNPSSNPSLKPSTYWVQLGNDFKGDAADDRAGSSVALSSDGSTLAFGVPQWGGDGYVRVYGFGSGWIQIGGDIVGETLEGFGISVDLSSDGSTVAIGAWGNDASGTNSGRVRVYTKELGWTKLGTDIFGEGQHDYFGQSVTLSSDGRTVAIGSKNNDGISGYNDGHVRVYKYGTNWVKLGSDIDGEARFDNSGVPVDISGNGSIVAIGARGNDGNGDKSGHVRVYEYDGTDWVQVGDDIDGEAAGDESGVSVAISEDGSIVAIGAIENDDNGDNSGHVRVYKYDGTAWVKLGEDIDGEAADDNFGYSVAISSDGSIVAIGAIGNDDNGDDSGHVRVYKYDGTIWSQIGDDIDGKAAGDEFGVSVAMSSDGSIVAIGAHYNDDNGDRSGYVRVYS